VAGLAPRRLGARTMDGPTAAFFTAITQGGTDSFRGAGGSILESFRYLFRWATRPACVGPYSPGLRLRGQACEMRFARWIDVLAVLLFDSARHRNRYCPRRMNLPLLFPGNFYSVPTEPVFLQRNPFRVHIYIAKKRL
jgi:hypothetical protein